MPVAPISPMTVNSSGQSSTPIATIEDNQAFGGSDLSTLSASEDGPTVTKIVSKKRASADVTSGAKRVKQAKEGERGVYCHQCRQRCEPDVVLRCTRLKQFTKNTAPRACNIAFCDRDLARRYHTVPDILRQREPGAAGHEPNAQYSWTCPCCMDECQASLCRKKKGLEPLGNVVPSFVSQILDVSTQERPPRNVIMLPFTFVSDSESDLSDPDEAPAPAASSSSAVPFIFPAPTVNISSFGNPAPKAASKPRPPTASSSKGNVGKKQKVKTKKDGAAKDKEAVKPSKQKTGKAAAKTGETKIVKPRLKKPEVIPDPPTFERVDTRLSYDEVEDRIRLREYLFRFRVALSLPERSLPATDDFDRTLTEASVRLFAGAMLDTFKDELDVTGGDQEDTLFNQREELRYYADFARFTAIFNSLTEAFDLKLPISGPDEGRRASRLPSAAEVVRMLLALADRTLVTPVIHADLDSTAGEFDARRRHAKAIKEETAKWDSEKKALNGATLQAKTPAEGKRIKEEIKSKQREYDLEVALANVNLRATLSRRSLRYEPLGTDLDGRVYHVLTARMIEGDGRPPIGWASGLLVWGKGVADEEDLPKDMYRWSHFGKSADVKKLVKWIEWRFKKARPAKSQTTPRKSLPATPRKSGFEIVIPSSRKKVRESNSSGLSTPPTPTDALYKPSPEVIAEQGNVLVERLKEVVEWLEVLEWKGMGEI